MSRLKGYLYKDDGTALQGATVTALEGSDANDGATIGSSTTTGSDGSWAFTSGLTGKNVDVKIQSGTSIRYLKHQDQVQVEHMWVRSDTAAGTAPLRVENSVDNASNLVLELVGDNATRADGDEIKVHFSLDNDAGEETVFARITAEANDVSNGTEDGELKFGVMVAGTLTDVFTINSSTSGVTDMNLDVSGDLTLDADGGDIFFKDGGTTFGSATNNSGNLILKSGTTTAATFTGANVSFAGDTSVGDDLTLGSDSAVINMGADNDATFTHDGTTGVTIAANPITLDSGADIVLDAEGANIIFKDGGTSILDIGNSSTDVELTVSTADKNFAIKGTDGSSAITALDIDMALAGKATFNGDVVVGGDLTITGDDLVMGTNTDSMLLIADGTNFNPTAISSLSEISSVQAADTLIAIDNSGGGLKKITRGTLVSGLASGTMTELVDDSSPQLGGNLDTNSNNIIIDDAHFISDENNNEQIIFQTTSSAVNQFDVTNAASGSAPQLSATGSDTNIDLGLLAKGSGHITIVGNSASGAIQFNCENNSHGQIVKAQAHSAGVTNVLTLPAGGDSTLVSLESTDTLTNKTLTSPKINEDVALTSTATELNLLDGVSGLVQADFTKLAAVDSTAAELNIVDGGTSATATTVADADRVVLNDNGTMVQVAVTDLAAYFDDEITAMPNLVSVGTLSTLTVDNVITNGTTIGHTDDTDLMTLADGVLSVAGNLDVSGSVETATIDFTDGDNALTIADGGGVTFPQAATFTGGFTANDDINLTKQKVIKIGGTQEAHDFGDEHTGHGITVTMEAGEDLTLGAAVYVDSNGKAQHPDVDASSVTGKPAIGIAMSGASDGASVNVLVLGLFHDDTYNFTPGSPIIMTGTDGALTTTASDTEADGDIVQRIGIAITADTAFIMPSIDEIEHA